MNDIITVIGLLSKTNHDYKKETIKMSNTEEWVKITLSNGIEFNFKKDGTLHYLYFKEPIK